MSLGGYNTVSIGTSATKIVSSNPERKGVLVVNNGAATIYIGPDSSITTSNAIPIYSQGSLDDSGLFDSYRGDIYGIVAAATVDCRYWEWIQ